MKCKWHLCNKEVSGKRKKYCSKNCSNKSAVTRKRRRYKEDAVDLKGGKCVRCGYNSCIDALQFHHIDGKDFQISDGNTKAWSKIIIELERCILVCANCHAEEHAQQRKSTLRAGDK